MTQRTPLSNNPPQLHCYRCGYALVGLDLGGRCPECGTEIAASQAISLFGHQRLPAVREACRSAMWGAGVGAIGAGYLLGVCEWAPLLAYGLETVLPFSMFARLGLLVIAPILFVRSYLALLAADEAAPTPFDHHRKMYGRCAPLGNGLLPIALLTLSSNSSLGALAIVVAAALIGWGRWQRFEALACVASSIHAPVLAVHCRRAAGFSLFAWLIAAAALLFAAPATPTLRLTPGNPAVMIAATPLLVSAAVSLVMHWRLSRALRRFAPANSPSRRGTS